MDNPSVGILRVIHTSRNAGFGASQRERLHLEGVRRFRAMIKQAGGTEPIKDVEERLGVSDDTISKRTKKKQMIAIPVGNRQKYPVWQFDGPQIVPNFEQALEFQHPRTGKTIFDIMVAQGWAVVI